MCFFAIPYDTDSQPHFLFSLSGLTRFVESFHPSILAGFRAQLGLLPRIDHPGLLSLLSLVCLCSVRLFRFFIHSVQESWISAFSFSRSGTVKNSLFVICFLSSDCSLSILFVFLLSLSPPLSAMTPGRAPIIAACLLAAILCVCVTAAPQRYKVLPAYGYNSAAGKAKYLCVEVLSDTMVHFEVSNSRDFPDKLLSQGIYTTQVRSNMKMLCLLVLGALLLLLFFRCCEPLTMFQLCSAKGVEVCVCLV